MSHEPLQGAPGNAPAPPAEAPPPARKRSTRDYVIAAATAALMALILGWLLYRERDALASIELTHAWPRLIAGQTLMLITLVVAALVWGSIMRALGSQVKRLDHVHIYASTFLSR